MTRMPNHCLDQAILALSILAIGSCNIYISIYLFVLLFSLFWGGVGGGVDILIYSADFDIFCSAVIWLQ